MTRCIHCTRCVRFTTEVAGVSELGLLGRGEDAEITTYLETAMTSEMQGNVIDLCPVGALTSRPYQDTARPWELTKTESIDVMDAVGSNIRVDARGREVMRIMPRLNEAVNEEWISDKTRFIWDGLQTQRLDQPFVRRNGKLKPATWDQAFNAIKSRVKATKPANIGAIAGELASVEDMYALKSLMKNIGSANLDCRKPGSVLDPSQGRESYLFNATIEGIEDSDALLIIGSNPRLEAAVLNSRILKRYKQGNYPIGVIGENQEMRYAYAHLGTGAEALKRLVSGKDKFASRLKKAKKPLILIGQGVLNRSDAKAIQSLTAQLAMDVGAVTKGWNGYSVLHTAAGQVGGLDVGFVPGSRGKATADIMKSCDLTFLLGADEIDMEKVNGFVVYVGTHGDAGAHRADVILPASTYTEKSATYVNTEGRVQIAQRASFAPGDAREDWAIFRALSAVLGLTLAFDSLSDLRVRLYEDYPHFAGIDMVATTKEFDVKAFGESLGARKTAKTLSGAFINPVTDFYLTNPIARASKVMAECSALNSGTMLEAAE